MPVRRSFLRPALLAAALLALLSIVALASRADRPGRPGNPEVRSVPVAFWDYVLTIGLVAIVVAFALALVLRVPLPSQRRREFGFTQFIAIALVCGLVVFAGSRAEWPQIRGDSGVADVFVDEPTEDVTTKAQAADRSEPESRSPRVRWPIVFGAALLALVGLAIYVARRRLRVGGVLAPASAASALTEALGESLEDLRAERDPRRAVIAAYARMERALDYHGLPRFRAEAPLEYLARVLRELSVRSSAVLALTELFERAKFSSHEIDAEMKEEAIGALAAVRDDLRAAL
jgi:H+/Cl- antiporter ClcA